MDYKYRCYKCGYEVVLTKSIHDPHFRMCPNCKKEGLKHVPSKQNVIFKGSGFTNRTAP